MPRSAFALSEFRDLMLSLETLVGLSAFTAEDLQAIVNVSERDPENRTRFAQDVFIEGLVQRRSDRTFAIRSISYNSPLEVVLAVTTGISAVSFALKRIIDGVTDSQARRSDYQKKRAVNDLARTAATALADGLRNVAPSEEVATQAVAELDSKIAVAARCFSLVAAIEVTPTREIPPPTQELGLS
jgi:hypothetical protein